MLTEKSCSAPTTASSNRQGLAGRVDHGDAEIDKMRVTGVAIRGGLRLKA